MTNLSVFSVLIDGRRIEIMVDQDSENDISNGYDEGIDVEDTRGMNKDQSHPYTDGSVSKCKF